VKKACLLIALLLAQASATADEHKPAAAAPSSAQTVPRWPRHSDPPPLVTRGFLKLTLRLEHGAPSLRKAVRGTFKKPRAILPRYAGRFAIELYAGKALLDVVRFDFPLAAAVGESGRAAKLPLYAGVSAETTVAVPFTDRITSARLRDTKTRAKSPGKRLPATEPLRLSTFHGPSAPAGPPSSAAQRKRHRRKPPRSRKNAAR